MADLAEGRLIRLFDIEMPDEEGLLAGLSEGRTEEADGAGVQELDKGRSGIGTARRVKTA